MSKKNTEYETKVLDINVEEIVAKLRSLGAVETPEYLARRYVFDMNSERIEFLRLRESNGKTTLAYKLKDRGNKVVGQTIELETEVADFDAMAEILLKVSFIQVWYQETKSWVFKLGDIEYSIDTWPRLAPFIEVEGKSLKKVQEGLEKLGLEGKDIGDVDMWQIYEAKGMDVHSIPELKF